MDSLIAEQQFLEVYVCTEHGEQSIIAKLLHMQTTGYSLGSNAHQVHIPFTLHMSLLPMHEIYHCMLYNCLAFSLDNICHNIFNSGLITSYYYNYIHGALPCMFSQIPVAST